MLIKYHAEFQHFDTSNPAAVGVYCTDGHGSRIYLGRLDPASQFAYEGKWVFLLDCEQLEEEAGGNYVHIPLNVLRQIAEYGD